MFKFFTLLFVFILIFSCKKSDSFSTNEKSNIPYYSLEEEFIDSTNIGAKGNSKVVIRRFKNDNSGDDSFEGSDDFVKIIFSRKSKLIDFNTQKEVEVWKNQETLYFEKDGILSIQPQIMDFDGDGFNDFAYQSGIAARGSNEVTNLFIYNSFTKEFDYIKNSEKYPNLSHNKELNCVESFIFTGSTTTVYLKVKNDSLKEFASVDFANTITVYENDKNEKSVKINDVSTNGFDAFIPFKSYKPLKQYTETELNQIRK